MALTIAIEGLGVIANADAETNDTGGDGTGDWGFTGSGGVGSGITQDTYYYGTDSMSMALSGAKNGWFWFNRGAGLDFTTTYAGQYVYIWMHCPTIGLSETLANAGVAIRIGSSTTNFRTYVVAGSDGSNGWDGAWKCFVIDPTLAGSIADGGTFDDTSVQYFGIRGATTATAKGDNFFISQIAVGSGLRITGTSTTAWKDVVDYCTDLPNRAWGMMQEREGIYYQYGKIFIGDDATPQAAAVSFEDSGRVIQAGISEFWSGTGTVFDPSPPIDYIGLVIEDDAAATNGVTTFTDGVIVGTDNGRSGSSFIGNANHDYSMDLYGGSNANSVVSFYGTKFQGLTGVLNSGNDGDHSFLGCSFVASSQFDPVGAPTIRNCTFAETTDVDSALLWNENIDIQDCNFIANTLGAAIEHPSSTGTPYSYSGLLFSGNTNDVLNSSGSAITVSLAGGSDATTSEGSAVTFSNDVEVTIAGLKDSTEIRVMQAGSNTVELAGTDSATTGTVDNRSFSFTQPASTSVDIYIVNIIYENIEIYAYSVPSTDTTLPQQQRFDRSYLNP